MKIAFNPSTVAALITPPNNKDITFDLRGRNIFARGVKFCGTDTNTWRDIKINNVSIGSNILDLRNGSNTTLTNTNGVVTINSTWRPVVDNLTSDSTTSSLSANQGRVLAGLINTLSTNISNQYALRDGSNATGRWRGGLACFDVRDTNYTPYDLNMGLELHFFDNNTNNLKDGGKYNGVFSFRQWASGSNWTGGKAHQLSFTDNGNIWHRTSSGDDSWETWKKLAYSTDIPSSLKNPYSLTTFGVVYDGSAAKVVSPSNFISQLGEGTDTVTDGTMFITSWASNSGFADTNAVNVPYKRKAIHLWEYIKAKTDSLYATKSHNHDDRYLRLTGGWMSGDINFGGDNRICWGRNTDSASISFKNDGDSDADSYMSFVTSDNGNEYFRWSHSSGSTNTEWMALRSDGLRVGGTKVSLEGHSHNDLYYTKTEVNNKLNGKSDTGHTHDDRYLKLTGGIMTGTINRRSGGSTISGRDHAIIRQTYAPGGSSWNPIACVDTETGTWTLGHLSSGSSDTNFHFCFSTNADYNAGNNNGNYVALRNKVGTIALLSDIPNKNSWNYDDRYVKKTGDTMSGVLTIDTTNFGALTIKRNDDANGASIQFRGKSSIYGYIGLNNSTKDKQFLRWSSDTSKIYTILDTSSTYTSNGKGVINGTTITQVNNADTTDGVHLEWSGQLTYDQYSWLAAWTNDGKKIKAVNKSQFATSGHNHDSSYVKYANVTKSTADSANANPYIYNIENETVISGYYNYWYILNLGQYSKGNFGTQIAMPYQTSLVDSELFIRSANNGSWRTWRRILHSNNYTAYTVTKNGTGANGTWGISITGNANTVDGYHISDESRQVYKNHYTVDNPAGAWILIKFPAWNGNNEIVTISGHGDNRGANCVVHCGSRNQGIWGYQSDYNGKVVDRIRWKEVDSGKFALVVLISGGITNLSIKSTSSLEISKTTEDNTAFAISSSFFSSGGVFHGNVDWDKIIGKPSSFIPSAHDHNYVLDIANNNHTTFAYSKPGISKDSITWLAVWNGYELRAMNKDQIALSGHTHDDRYLKLSGGTMTGIIRATNRGGSWISGRDHCLIRSDDKTSYSYWSAILAIATVNGYWTLGHLGDGGERIGFNYDTDADYNAGRNNNHVIWLPTGGAEGTLALTSDNVASATKLQTARSIWGHSFNGTADVNGTIYINNSNSSEGAIRLNNNVNSNARISAIDSQVIFNTDAAIRFGGTSWDWNQWAGLKYNHSNKTIYLGIADGSIFNANSAQVGGTLNFRAGVSTIQAPNINFGNTTSGLGYGLEWTCGDNDFARIKAGATGSDAGYLEIATADGGNEPIYVRQYTGVFSSVKRTLTLLDANGYTHFPSYINIGGNENNNSSPDRVWGSNGSDSYLRSYRTSALNVNYAASAGNADTVDGYHASAFAAASHTHPYLPLSGAYITGTNIADMKVNIRNYFNGKPAGTNCYVGSPNIIYNFQNDSAACDANSVCGIMALNPGYDNYNHGHFLVSHYGDNRIGMIGLGYQTWYGPNWFAYTSDIPTVTNYYWANVKVSASSSTTTYPTFGNLAVVNDGSNSGYDALAYFRHHADTDWAVIISANNYGLDIRKNSGGSYSLRNAGNSRLIGATIIGTDVSPSYTLDVRGTMRSTNRIYANEWIQFDNASGLYWSNTYGAHFYPNATSTYGQFQLLGTKNSYSGIHFGNSTNYMTVMSTDTHHGLYCENTGTWEFYYNRSNGGVGIRTSSITKNFNVSGQSYLSSNVWIGTTSGSEMLNIGGWVGTTGNTGWYNISYGGGIYMSDNTYVRVYNDKRFYNSNTSQYAFYTSGGMTALGHMWSSSSAQSWLNGQKSETAALNIAASSNTNSYWPWFRQTLTAANKWISVGTLSNSLYFIGSATSRTENSYDYGFRMDFSNGYLYGNFSGYLSGTAYSAEAIKDSNNGTRITACYSTGGFSSNPSWLTAWNGYHLTYVSPSVLSVNYANSAGNADTVDGYHANGLLTALSNSNNGISITVGGTTKSISNISVNYANSAGNADTLDNTHLNGIFTAFGNNAHNITATIGGVTKSFLVNWAADSDKLDGYHASGLLTSVTNTNNGISVTVGGTTKSVSNISVNYANSAGSANSATQATNLTPENTPHYFRDPNNSIWRGGMYWGNAGNESMSFVAANGGTRFQFVGGSDIANWTSSTWQSVTPYLTIYSSGIVTPGSVTATNGFHHANHDNNDAVLLAGGGYSQGVPVKYWSIESISIYGPTQVFRVNRGGNYTFITKVEPRIKGSCVLTLQFPSGYYYENTIIWARGVLNNDISDSSNSTIYATIFQFSESKYYLNLSDDDSLNNGTCQLYFMCF